MPFGIGIWELVILMVLLLLVFGAKRLPEMGRSIGHGMREFKDAVTGKDEPEPEAERTELTPPAPSAQATTPPPAPSTQADAPPPATEQPAETERVSR
jgi:sec-independent protein translocase protein TatA